MADVFFIQSRDPAVVAVARSAAADRLRELAPEGLIDRADGPGWALITSRNPYVPYAVSSDALTTALVIGATYGSEGPEISDLRSPSSATRVRAIRDYCRHLNFGLALSIADGEVLVAADWLGLYPVYHYRDESAFVVTSVPGLLRCHGDFRPAVDLRGLVGILLLAHSCLGRTMFQGVSRLPSGHFLQYRDGSRMTTEAVGLGAWPSAPRNIDEAVEAIGAVLDRTVAAAAREGVRSVYLSGGLDSRTVAGYLRQHTDGELTAVTLGDRGDLEMRAAARVASALGAVHERVPIDRNDHPAFALRTIERDAMSGGLYSLMTWSFAATPRRPVLTGFLGDSTLGASQVDWGRDPTLDRHTFPAMFASVNAWGLSPGIVRELVRTEDIDDIVFDVWRRLGAEYDATPGPPWQRSWWFDLLHRERFIVGQAPKVIASRSWPVLPYVHTDILRIVQASPLSFVADRKAQTELILRRFPGLARLPFARLVDRQLAELVPRRTRFWTPSVDRVKSSIAWHWHDKIDRKERRVFLRVFDFDGPGWRVLRDEARARAGDAEAWLDKDIVLRLIPGSATDARLGRPIVEATGRKALLGAVLCCSRYFS